MRVEVLAWNMLELKIVDESKKKSFFSWRFLIKSVPPHTQKFYTTESAAGTALRRSTMTSSSAVA
jgi:hypothetical protein